MATPRLMIVFTLATAGVVLIVAALATESWWLLPIALLAHAAATAITVVAIKRTAAQKDKPDAVTEARLEEEAKESSGHERSRNGDGDEPQTVI